MCYQDIWKYRHKKSWDSCEQKDGCISVFDPTNRRKDKHKYKQKCKHKDKHKHKYKYKHKTRQKRPKKRKRETEAHVGSHLLLNRTTGATRNREKRTMPEKFDITLYFVKTIKTYYFHYQHIRMDSYIDFPQPSINKYFNLNLRFNEFI